MQLFGKIRSTHYQINTRTKCPCIKKKQKKKKEEEAYPLAMYHLDFDLIIVINNIQPVKARTSATFTEAYCYSRALFLCSSKL